MSNPIQQTKPPEYGAMRATLMELRRRAEAGDTYHPAEAVKLIDALFAGDVRYQIRQIIGDATLTARQWDLLEFVYRYRQQHDACPTYQEIGDAMGISKVSVFEQVQELLRKGVLRRDGPVNSGKHRSLIISRPPPRPDDMPARMRAAAAWSSQIVNRQPY